MATTMKTPAMILHELAIKVSGKAARYTKAKRISSGTEPIEYEYEYMVEVLGISTSGRGCSKRDAKQETAKNALLKLSEKYNLTSGELIKDLDVPKFKNYIGELRELCLFNKLPVPQYELIFDGGPPHQKMFTYEGRIGQSIVLRNTTRTKKQAKQNLARMMLGRIVDILPSVPPKEDDTQQSALCEAAEPEVVEQSDIDDSDSSPNTTNVIVHDYYKHLKHLMIELNLTYDDIKEYFKRPRTLEAMEELCKKLELDIIVEVFTDNNFYIVAINVSSTVPLCTMGMNIDKELAINQALEQLFLKMHTLVRL